MEQAIQKADRESFIKVKRDFRNNFECYKFAWQDWQEQVGEFVVIHKMKTSSEVCEWRSQQRIF